MPIVEVPKTNGPLKQGDVLQGIKLFTTKEPWGDDGGSSVKTEHNLCLITSRPCNLANKAYANVVGVRKWPDATPKGLDSFEKTLDFLTTFRDGDRSPDVFYLGQLPNLKGRYCADLDSFHTIQIPRDIAEQTEFATKRRIASLTDDFVRDLHLRVFRTVASLGFDDLRWFSKFDLEMLVERGKADIVAAELALTEANAKKAQLEADGKQIAQKDIDEPTKRLANLRAKISPYIDEVDRRSDEKAVDPTE